MRVPGSTVPLRRRLANLWRQAQRRVDPPGLILLYHRVARPSVDPWGVSVRPERFAEHLEVLRQVAEPVPLGHLLDTEPSGRLKARQVALTFDDGYADTLHQAVPLLEQAQVPATVFVASGYVGQAQPFWWDELAHLLLQPHPLLGPLRLNVGETVHTWPLDNRNAPLPGWQAETGAPPGPRERLYLTLYGLLRPLDPQPRTAAMEALRHWAEPQAGSGADPFDRPVTVSELVQLAAHPLIQIGAHTVTHPALGELSPLAQRKEMLDSRATLEQLTGRPVTSFSFPFGSYGEESAKLVQEAGFHWACISAGQAVRRRTPPLALPRVSVGDWTGQEFAAKLNHWLGAPQAPSRSDY